MPHDLPGVSVDLTTEVRWFFEGPLPADVRAWFTCCSIGLTEQRCDAYHLDGRLDIGVKQRSQQTLEMKLRTRSPEPISLSGDVNGSVETWRRWSPADALLSLDNRAAWINVEKTVFKRRYDTAGREHPLSQANRAMTGEGCDVEIGALRARGQEAWTFAFAAFGRPETHRESLSYAWRSLVAAGTRPDQLRLDINESSGYPEWIAKTNYNISWRNRIRSVLVTMPTRSPSSSVTRTECNSPVAM